MRSFNKFIFDYLKTNIPKEIILNIALVFYNARFACLLEYTNFSSYYTKDEFYILLLDIIGKINILQGPMICICIEKNDDFPRYLLFLHNNLLMVEYVMHTDQDPHWKVGFLLEMTKPGGNFDDNSKPRLCGRIVVEKYPGIDLFTEVFPIINLENDTIFINNTLLFRLHKYNIVLTYFGYPCKIETEIINNNALTN